MKHLQTLTCIVDVAQSGSVRKTAERLNLTPSAVTRKIQDFERELGAPLFERTTQGMRLNAAGELFVPHARSQAADLDRVRAAIADLSGLRRGHVALVCSQAFIGDVMPDEIGKFRARYPDISFAVQARDHAQAAAALLACDAELALTLQPPPLPELQVLAMCGQPVCAVMDNKHPLAGTGPLRLRECLGYPVAMPDRSLSVRHLLDGAILRSGVEVNCVVESGSIDFLRSYVRREGVLSFQISIGIPAEPGGLVVREIDGCDLAPLQVVLTQLRGRTLSTAGRPIRGADHAQLPAAFQSGKQELDEATIYRDCQRRNAVWRRSMRIIYAEARLR